MAYKLIYMVNGWEEGRKYFLSFGFSESAKRKMYHGEVVEKDGNEFCVAVRDEYGHNYEDPSEVSVYEDVF